MTEWGIFSDESADYSEEEAIEAAFYSKEEAEAAFAERYADDDTLVVHAVEEPDEDDEDADDWGEDDDEGPTPY